MSYSGAPNQLRQFDATLDPTFRTLAPTALKVPIGVGLCLVQELVAAFVKNIFFRDFAVVKNKLTSWTCPNT